MTDEQDVEAPESDDQPKIDSALKEAVERLQKARSVYLRAADDAKELKKSMEAAQGLLEEIANAMVHPPAMPLYDQQTDEGWQRYDVGELDLSNKINTALVENTPPLNTLGELAEWMRQKGDFWAKDIAGIGDAARKQIEDAFEQFWVDHPDCCETPERDEATDDAGGPGREAADGSPE